MPISKTQLGQVVQSWSDYTVQQPQKIKPGDLLKTRDISMYRGLGITIIEEFARALVEHRSAASLEMTMGYLFERLLEESGLTKVSKEDKKKDGYLGVDFIHPKPTGLEVVTLKASPSTFNGDITRATVVNLMAAKEFWESRPKPDDNPLAQQQQRVTMVRAVARGAPKRTTTPEGILWIVGDAMWDYFGAGPDLLQRLGDALGRNPLDHNRYEKEKEQAVTRVVGYLRRRGFAKPDGGLDWAGLIKRFP